MSSVYYLVSPLALAITLNLYSSKFFDVIGIEIIIWLSDIVDSVSTYLLPSEHLKSDSEPEAVLSIEID